MLNILKWDFINYIRRYSWLYFGLAAALMIAVLPDNLPVSPFLDGLSAAYSMFFFCFATIVSVVIAVNWLRKDSAQLELSVPTKPWKKLLGKLVLSACIITSNLLLTQLLWMQIDRFGMSNITVFTDYIGFFQYLLLVLTVVSAAMFSYIIAKSFSYIRRIAGLIAVLTFIAINTLLGYFAFVFSINTGIMNLERITKYGDIYITANQNMNWLGTLLSIIGPAVLIAIFFLGSSALLIKKFERY